MCDNFEILKLVSELAEKESDRMWTRFTTMLYLNSALVGFIVIAIRESDKFLPIMVSILGVALSIIWLTTLSWSFVYQDRWIKDQKKLIENNPEFKKLIKARKDEHKSPNWFMGILSPRKGLWHAVPILYFVFWIIVLLYSLKII